MEQSDTTRLAESVSRRLGPVMFCLSVAFLVFVAVELSLVIGVSFYEAPQRSEASSPDTWLEEMDRVRKPLLIILVLLLLCWCFFPLEAALMWFLRGHARIGWKARTHRLSACLLPPLRIGVRNEFLDGKIWLPFIGWHEVNEKLRRRVERHFSVPMIVIALLILPVLFVEWRWTYHGLAYDWLKWAFLAATALIWFAFALEFCVMVSIAKNRFTYCKDHWLDLAIILLPLISFLRSLKSLRSLRLARFAKAHQLAKLSRVYSMRGLALRAFRGIIVLEVVHRVLRIGPAQRLRRLKAVLEERELELELLREDIRELEDRIARSEEAVDSDASVPDDSGDETESDYDASNSATRN